MCPSTREAVHHSDVPKIYCVNLRTLSVSSLTFHDDGGTLCLEVEHARLLAGADLAPPSRASGITANHSSIDTGTEKSFTSNDPSSLQ
jgi:hypothetical protein